jgi:hypothetical protein
LSEKLSVPENVVVFVEGRIRGWSTPMSQSRFHDKPLYCLVFAFLEVGQQTSADGGR